VCRPTADELADMSDSGLDISRFLTNQGEMKQPLASIRVDIPQEMLERTRPAGSRAARRQTSG